MLDLTMRLRDRTLPERCDDDGLTWSAGSVRKFSSRHLRTDASFGDEQVSLWIGEAGDPYGDCSREQAHELYRLFSGYEGAKVFVTQREDGLCVSVARTMAGSCPLYVTSVDGELTCSWSFETVAAARRRNEPDLEACRLFLHEGANLSREQVLLGVNMLWQGEMVTCTADGMSFERQREIAVVTQSFLRDRAPASKTFLHLVADQLRLNVGRSEGVLLEVSGGLDSSCTAVAAASLDRSLSSYGLIHEGAMALQQQARRQEIVQLLELADHEFPSFRHPPMSSLAHEETSITPFDDNHRLSCTMAIDTHPDGPHDLVVTGIGGDELFMEEGHNRRDWEAGGVISRSAVLASVGRADMFLRRGIWPSNPLATLPVVNFCRRLPKELRDGRLLQILALARSGLSDGYLFPRYTEHYGHVLVREASLVDFDAELGKSVLGDLGLAEVHLLSSQAREAVKWGFTSGLAHRLWRLLKLEKILKRYC